MSNYLTIKNYLEKTIEELKVERTDLEGMENFYSVAVFWDYENFPIPKGLDPVIFLETLFPLESNYNYVTRRIYGNLSNISPTIRRALDMLNFEHIKELISRKNNAADFIMTADCASFCAQSNSPLTIFLITGDSDFLPLISNLIKQGHNIRIICQDKQKLSQQIHEVVPSIFDKNDLMRNYQLLFSSLVSLSQLITHLILQKQTKNMNISEIVQHLEKTIINNRRLSILGRLNRIFQVNDLNKHFKFSNDQICITNHEEGSKNDWINPINFKNSKNAIMLQLGSEPDLDKWEEAWRKMNILILNPVEQEKLLKTLAKISLVPIIRNRIQQKILQLVYQREEDKQKINLMLRNLSTKKYICSNCSKSFKSKQSLQQHREDAHKKQAFKCTKCSKAFGTKNALNQHQQAVHNTKTSKFECKSCKKSFTSKNSLQQHKKMKHQK